MASNPKHRIFRSDTHLAFVRKLPCLACNTGAPTEAAHIRIGGYGGMGMKPSDDNVVPLCSACHRRQHQHGERTFWGAGLENAATVAHNLTLFSGDIFTGTNIVLNGRLEFMA